MNSEHALTITGSPRRAWLGILLAFASIALSPAAQALLPSPPPDGGYPGGNTAEGTAALFNLTSGTANTAVGAGALFSNTTGGGNVGIGSNALRLNTSGNFNMAIGTDALRHNTANSNLAIGFQVLFANTTGNNLTGIGAGALFQNTTGSFNTAVGAAALGGNTSGANNTAVGRQSLNGNTTGSNNTAVGTSSLSANTTGHDNMATGYQALLSNTTGYFNMANGQQALYSNTTGYQNTANGAQSLFRNVDGFNNTAYGFAALAFNVSGEINTAIGFDALFNCTGSGNIALGQAAGFNLTTGTDNIDIGAQGIAAESKTIRIGTTLAQIATFIAGIRDTTTGNMDAIPVVIDSAGQLGTVSSSERFKTEIKPMDQTSEAILRLKPVTFHYKKDSKSTPQFGLIAEEVAKVDPNLIVRDAQGKIYTVRYDAVNAMLLNEFLKEHRTVQEQQKQIQALAAQVREQAALLRKVSDRLELNKPARQMAVNNQ
jgi:hypothetical protein